MKGSIVGLLEKDGRKPEIIGTGWIRCGCMAVPLGDAVPSEIFRMRMGERNGRKTMKNLH